MRTYIKLFYQADDQFLKGVISYKPQLKEDYARITKVPYNVHIYFTNNVKNIPNLQLQYLFSNTKYKIIMHDGSA